MINGSALTGNLTLTLGANLTSNDTVQGGAGTGDTLRATTGGTIATGLSISGFETIRLDSGANSTLSFATAPAATTLRIDTGIAGGVKTLSNLGSFTTLQFRGTGTAATAANEFIFNGITATGGFTGTADALAVAFSNSGVTATNATPYAAGLLNVAGVETFNVSVADATANTTNVLLAGLTSSTLQSAVFTGASSFGVTTARVGINTAAATNSVAAINFSGVTSTVASFINVGIDNPNTLASVTQITAGVGGLTAGIASLEQASDTIIFTGGAGADSLDLTVGTGNFAGSVTANLGAGSNTLLTGTGAALVSITADVATTTANTITVATVGAVSYVATGALTTSNINGGNVATNVTAAASTRAITFAMGTAADTLVGGNGNDTITGGGAADRMTGGTGADLFIQAAGSTAAATAGTAFTAAATTIAEGETFVVAADNIIDFSTLQLDTLRIQGVAGAATVTLGATAITNAGTNDQFLLRGTFAAGTFTAAAAGADVLAFLAGGVANGNATLAATLGTSSTVLVGVGANIANIGAQVIV